MRKGFFKKPDKSTVKSAVDILMNNVHIDGPYNSTYKILKKITSKDEPSLKEKIQTLRKDTKTEGGKQGYARAAGEYSDKFHRLEGEYEDTIRFIEQKKKEYSSRSRALLDKYEELERRRDQLKSELRRMENRCSTSLNFPIERAFQTNSLSGGPILDIAYIIKKKRISKEAEKAYQEAKSMFEKKISDLRNKLDSLKSGFAEQEKKYIDSISRIMKEISNLQISIADLEFVMG